MASSYHNPSQEALRATVANWTPQELEAYQLERLRGLLDFVQRESAFYRQRLGESPIRLQSIADWKALPLLSKSDLEDSHDAMGLGKHHTFPRHHYTRFHRTSGTIGRPMSILDTPADWKWWIDIWQYVLDAAELTADDRVMLAFSFGPFIGFWSAFDACTQRNAMVIPTGGMSTLARLHLMLETRPTVLCCTPNYALQIAEVAQQQGHDLREVGVRCLIVAGEPGGSIPAVRLRLEQQWGAKVVDHAGATEIGPWGVGGDGGLFVIETEFFPEFLPVPAHRQERQSDEVYELVLTNFGRLGSPLIRYRTGDLVNPQRIAGSPFVKLCGGVLGRADDMIVIRGVNVFPSSLEAIVRSLPGIGEYRITIEKRGEMDEMYIEAEGDLEICRELAEQILIRVGLRTDVRPVARQFLERSVGKSKRIRDLRGQI